MPTKIKITDIIVIVLIIVTPNCREGIMGEYRHPFVRPHGKMEDSRVLWRRDKSSHGANMIPVVFSHMFF